jgi:hypothetical protein
MQKSVAKEPCLSVAAVLRMAIICALRNHGHSAAKSAMSSLFRYVADITAMFITAVTKLRGGIKPVSTRP